MSAVLRTARLDLREMNDDDLDDMAALLGDAEVMRYYPRPRTRDEAKAWIDWNRGLYAERGHGLWYVALRETGEFVGDCGLVPQEVDGRWEIEVGYHVVPRHWRKGFAAEAAAACRDHARDVLGVDRLIALINPDNAPSQAVARRIGLRHEKDTEKWDQRLAVFSTNFGPRSV